MKNVDRALQILLFVFISYPFGKYNEEYSSSFK